MTIIYLRDGKCVCMVDGEVHSIDPGHLVTKLPDWPASVKLSYSHLPVWAICRLVW